MAVENYSQLIERLEEADYNSVTGTPESVWIDFKQTGYEADKSNIKVLSKRGKYELCKDVAEFANKQGGCLVLGYEDIKSTTLGLSVAGAVKPIKRSSINIDHYKGLIEANIYPLVSDIKFRWFSNGLSEKGVLVINIPKSDSSPHIVKSVVEENGTTVHGFVIPERNDDRTYIYPAEKIYELITRPKDLESQVKKTYRITVPDQTSLKVREALITSHNWENEPVVIYQLVPDDPKGKLKSFYENVQSSLMSPTPIRRMGFGLGSLGNELQSNDGTLLIEGSRDAVLSLHKNGTFTLALKITPQLAGWGLNKDNNEIGTIISSTVMIELCLEFCIFAYDVLEEYGLDDWSYTLISKNLKSSKSTLFYSRATTLAYADHPSKPNTDNSESKIDKTGDAYRDAFKIVEELYGLFSVPETKIPYANEGKIDPEKLRDLNKNPW